jgi:phosphoribosyl-AMP cyclohydrolase
MRLLETIKFDNNGFVPVAVTNHVDNRLLVICFMDREALQKTLKTGFVHVFRRSYGKVVMKGETSGYTQAVKEVRVNCDDRSLEIRVAQNVAACHRGYFSCFYRRYDKDTGTLRICEERIFDPDSLY